MCVVNVENGDGYPRWVLFRCVGCKEFSVFDMGRKTRKCPSCGHVNKRGAIVVIRAYHEKSHAFNALRYAKIPAEDREGVPYIAGDVFLDLISSDEMMARFITIIKLHQDDVGISLNAVEDMARDHGVDLDVLHTSLSRGKEEGTIVQAPGQKLRFV